MTRLIALALVMFTGACSWPQHATPAPSGFTSSNGGADAFMHMQPKGMSNTPYY